MAYVLKTSQVVINSRDSIVLGPFTGTEISINLTNTVQTTLERLEYDGFSIRWEIDNRIGVKTRLFFGETSLSLDVPQSGYYLRLFPSRYVFNYSVKVYENEPAVNLAQLALKTGIAESLLRLQSSQSILLLSATYTTNWTNAALLNGFNNLGGSFQVVRYALKNGVVHIHGACTRTYPIVFDTGIFNLPVGMRPQMALVLPSAGMLNNSENEYRLVVDNTGKVSIFGSGVSGDCNIFFSCSFVP